jgi:uncharacterized protein with HEPN domain
LLVIAEAATQLTKVLPRMPPGPDWPGIRGMGNMIRHAYHLVNMEVVWNITEEELPDLRAAVLKWLSQDLADNCENS